MARFSWSIPFKAGETWCKKHFFSTDFKPLGEAPRVISWQGTDFPAVKECKASKTSAPTRWGDQMPVIQVAVVLQSPAEKPAALYVTVEVDVEGDLTPCSEAADACEGDASG